MKGKTLEAFLDDFEGVPRTEAIAALEQAYERLLEGRKRSRGKLVKNQWVNFLEFAYRFC